MTVSLMIFLIRSSGWPDPLIPAKGLAGSRSGSLLHLECLLELSELRGVLGGSPRLFLLELLARPDV